MDKSMCARREVIGEIEKVYWSLVPTCPLERGFRHEACSSSVNEQIEKTVRWYLDHQEWMNRITSGEYEKYYEEMYKMN